MRDNMLILISHLNIWSYKMIKLVLFKIKGLANGDLEPLIYFMDTSIFIFKQTATNYFIQIWKFYLNEKYFSFVLLSFYLVILNYKIYLENVWEKIPCENSIYVIACQILPLKTADFLKIRCWKIDKRGFMFDFLAD